MADIATVNEALRIKFERGRAEHAGKAGDWADWERPELTAAKIGEVLDWLLYAGEDDKRYVNEAADRKLRLAILEYLHEMAPADVLAAAYGSEAAMLAGEEAWSDASD